METADTKRKELIKSARAASDCSRYSKEGNDTRKQARRKAGIKDIGKGPAREEEPGRRQTPSSQHEQSWSPTSNSRITSRAKETGR